MGELVNQFREYMQTTAEGAPKAASSLLDEFRAYMRDSEENDKEAQTMAGNREEADFEDKLLAKIRHKEAGSLGYDSYINFNYGAPKPPKPVSQMTFAEVFDFQSQLLRSGMPSSAVGGYQIIKKTLKGAMRSLGLKLDDTFDEDTQERIAREYLLRAKRKKGFSIDDYMEGKISKEDFAWSLSTEWASFPVLDERVRHTDSGPINISPGQSFYRGVGSNKALFKGNQLTEYSTFLDSGVSQEVIASDEDGSDKVS